MSLSKYDLEDIKYQTNRYVEKLEQQLQTYKDKEEKLKTKIETTKMFKNSTFGKELLQILNDKE